MFDIKVNIIDYTIEDNEKLDKYDIEYIEELIMKEYSKG
jgi:hypothetical protein